MNKKLFTLFTSTGTLVVDEENLNVFLFYDGYSGYVKNILGNCSYLHNIRFDIFNCNQIRLYSFFYSQPLNLEELSLPIFFKKFIENLNTRDIYSTLEDHDYSPFIWEIGTLRMRGDIDDNG